MLTDFINSVIEIPLLLPTKSLTFLYKHRLCKNKDFETGKK